MRIGYDAKRLFHNYTGLGNYSRTLLTNLATYYPDEEYYLYSPRIKESPLTEHFLDGSAYSVNVPEKGFSVYWRSYAMVGDLIRDEVDLFHGLSNELPIPIRKRGLKCVVSIHDLIFRTHPHTYPLIDRKIYDYKFRRACESADLIIAISQSTKKDIMSFYSIPEEKIRVVYQSCHPIYYQKQDPMVAARRLERYKLPKDYLLYVGSVIERKNLLLIIRALSMLPESERLPLVIVGKGNGYRKRVEQEIIRAKLDRQCYWLDEVVDQLSLQALYQCATLFLYPSLYEGFGIPVAESLLSGCPVITSTSSSLPEAGGPFSTCIDPESPEELAEAIRNLIHNPSEREHRSRNGESWAGETFDPAILSAEMMDCYKAVISAYL